MRDNAAAGFRIAFPAAYKNNAITSNTGGTVVGGAQVNLGGNFCTDYANLVVVCP